MHRDLEMTELHPEDLAMLALPPQPASATDPSHGAAPMRTATNPVPDSQALASHGSAPVPDQGPAPHGNTQVPLDEVAVTCCGVPGVLNLQSWQVCVGFTP